MIFLLFFSMVLQLAVFPCVFDDMIAMKTHVKVSGTELKVRIEKVFTTPELRAALRHMVELVSDEGSAFPCWMEGVIIERLRNAGVDLKKYGGWYRYIAAYAILPKMEEIIELERKYGNPPGSGSFDDTEVTEKWLELIGTSAGIIYNELMEEFKDLV